jgi:hypothetical protein
MTPEFLTLLGVIVLQLANMYNNYQNAKVQREIAAQQVPLTDAQAEKELSESWVKLAQEYQRQIESLKGLEIENASLRPLVLKLALQEEQMKQDKRDKEDWKRYSQNLIKQIEGASLIPIPFARYVNGDSDKMKTIRDTKDKIKPVEIAK